MMMTLHRVSKVFYLSSDVMTAEFMRKCALDYISGEMCTSLCILILNLF